MPEKIERLNIVNNFTKVENGLLEWKARTKKLGKPERQILEAIIRKTNGYNRVEAKISIRLFAKITGIERRNVWRYIKMMVEKEIIFRQPGEKDKYGKRIYHYSINGKYRRYNYVRLSQIDAKAVINPTPPAVVEQTSIKDNNVKKRYKENIRNIMDKCNNFELHYEDKNTSSNEK